MVCRAYLWKTLSLTRKKRRGTVHPHLVIKKTNGIKTFFPERKEKNEMSPINGANFCCGGEN
jgi:hypothetical protein